MSKRHLTLKYFLRLFPNPGFGAKDVSIHQRRSRAKKAGLPDPYPFLEPVPGVRGLVVIEEKYNAWAPAHGKPAFDFKRGGEGR